MIFSGLPECWLAKSWFQWMMSISTYMIIKKRCYSFWMAMMSTSVLENHLSLKIWKGARLTNVHVIITTRQEKTDELRRPSDFQFEINGFKSYHQIFAFVSKVLGDEEKVEEFVTYLHKRDLKDLAEIPLLLLMLCTVWNENNSEELSKSRARICQNFVLTLIHHAITKDAKAEEEEDINVLEFYNVE